MTKHFYNLQIINKKVRFFSPRLHETLKPALCAGFSIFNSQMANLWPGYSASVLTVIVKLYFASDDKKTGRLLRFELFPPCAALTEYVACFIISESDAMQPYAVLPDTALVMGFQYHGRLAVVADNGACQPLATAGITGLQLVRRHFQNVSPSGSILVRFKPGGAAAFFRPPVNELFEQSLSLDLFTARSAISIVEERLSEAQLDTARIQIIEDFLLSCKIDRPADTLVLEAVRLIEQSAGMLSIAGLAKRLHTSASPLEKRFRSLIGTSPKKFARIVRFQSILAAGHLRHGAAARAYEAGYFDQAHFIKDFKRFSGQTPETFFAGKQR